MSIAFVIPVIHPDHPSLTDYSAVERMLRLTVESLLAQTEAEAAVVVSCHRRPEWADLFPDRLLILEVGGHSALAPLKHSQFQDKFLKMALGALAARGRFAPEHIMLADADDFVCATLARGLRDGAFGPSGQDGFIIREGYHVQLELGPTSVEVLGAVRITSFQHTCGTCRVFNTPALMRWIDRVVPGLSDTAPAVLGRSPSGDDLHRILDRLEEGTVRQGHDSDAPPQVIGNHHVAGGVDLAPIDAPLAAKGCGHGNHIGDRRGQLHWLQSLEKMPSDKFIEEFGLAGVAGIHATQNPQRFARLAFVEKTRVRVRAHAVRLKHRLRFPSPR